MNHPAADPPGRTGSAVGPRIREAREALRISQTTLAARVGSTQSTVSLYESGQRAISWDLLIVLARVLDRPLGYLLGEGTDVVSVKPQIAALVRELESSPADAPALLRY